MPPADLNARFDAVLGRVAAAERVLGLLSDADRAAARLDAVLQVLFCNSTDTAFLRSFDLK